jgi:hypothetical protein
MMQRRLVQFATFLLFTCSVALGAVQSAHAGVADLHGREWRRLDETNGITWSQVAQLCPQDGTSPCTGSINGRNLTGWMWATESQVVELFSDYAPEILNSPTLSVGGYEYVVPATAFQGALGFTQHLNFCTTYQGCVNFKFAGGWTATTDGSGVASGADVSINVDDLFGTTAGFRVNKPNPGEQSPRGAFLWRATGLEDGTVYAYDDVGQSPTPFGGVAVNVLANDWIGGERPTPESVVLSQLTAPPAGITLNANGSVTVAPGTAVGTSTFSYQICDVADETNCDDATVTITMKSYPIITVNDQGSVSFGVGGTPVANVLINDKLGGLPATTAVVSLTTLSSTHAGITLNVNGAVNVVPGTPNGIHSLIYQICERANPANCAQATVTLTPYSIDAVNDSWRLSSKTGATSPSVLANDWFKGARATTAQVKIALLSPLMKGVTFNLSTGVFTIAPKTQSGTYPILYRICEINSPENCDSATATLNLSGKDD